MPMMLSATFEIFDRLQKAGDIPAGVKYQIDMATPLAITYNFMVPSIYDSFVEIYTDHLADGVRADTGKPAA